MERPSGTVRDPKKGSIGAGICAGLFGGCVGLLLVLLIAKGRDTKQGAAIGFALGLVIALSRLWAHA